MVTYYSRGLRNWQENCVPPVTSFVQKNTAQLGLSYTSKLIITAHGSFKTFHDFLFQAHLLPASSRRQIRIIINTVNNNGCLLRMDVHTILMCEQNFPLYIIHFFSVAWKLFTLRIWITRQFCAAAKLHRMEILRITVGQRLVRSWILIRDNLIAVHCATKKHSLVRLIRWQAITFVCFFVNKRTKDKLSRLHNEQTVYGLRKKFPGLPFSFFHLKRQHKYVYVYICRYIDIYTSIYCRIYICCRFDIYSIYIYIFAENRLTENGNFHLFAVNGKRKGKLPFVFCKR